MKRRFYKKSIFKQGNYSSIYVNSLLRITEAVQPIEVCTFTKSGDKTLEPTFPTMQLNRKGIMQRLTKTSPDE